MQSPEKVAEAYRKMSKPKAPPVKLDKYDSDPLNLKKNQKPDFFQEILRKELSKKLSDL